MRSVKLPVSIAMFDTKMRYLSASNRWREYFELRLARIWLAGHSWN